MIEEKLKRVHTPAEEEEILQLESILLPRENGIFSLEESAKIKDLFKRIKEDEGCFDEHDLSLLLMSLRTAELFSKMVDTDKNMILAILLYPMIQVGLLSKEMIAKEWDDDLQQLLSGVEKVSEFSSKSNIRNSENYKSLILSLTKDIRVIIIMIVRSLALMRSINNHPDDLWVRNVAFEANFLYAQLSHRLGLYKIKSELEDLYLKYTDREIYKKIAHTLKETKRSRDAYIDSFIGPVKEKLESAGLKFDIKGRTKSISSIWAKIKKQKVDMNHIYDLFAIRIILDSEPVKEKADCWLAYSIITDMFTANPARMKDWVTIPKSNGYESLHITVMGPDNKWVEVQIRTKRMDLVAEKGLAAHWRYKGVKADDSEQWMNNIRDILESADRGPMQLMKNIQSGKDNKEVFVFTPKGDIFRLPIGASILDFAFSIHSNIGMKCTGAVVNGVAKKMTYRLVNGDSVEIITSSNQKPTIDWLNFVITSKARNRIRQSLNEEKIRKAELGKELFERRAKNRKIDIPEAVLMKLIKKQGYKHANDFFSDLADEKVDIQKFLFSFEKEVSLHHDEQELISADEFRLKNEESETETSDDILVIGDKNIKGLKYKFAKCCSPICGDKVFGFISSDGIIKIHKNDCPNAANIMRRYPYRLIKVEWSGTQGTMLPATIKIIGRDDIGIVTNITSIISKEKDMSLRNIAIDADDGLFQGVLTIAVTDNQQLNKLIKKLETVKGVKKIIRL